MKKPRFPDLPAGNKAETFILESRPFKIGDDDYAADFGTIAVPENRDKEDSPLIHIPFLRINTNSEDPGPPVFGLTGGPGISNMSWDWGKARTFLDRHDFVIVGYRGVDGSIRLDCPEVKKAMKGDGDLFGEESMKNIAGAWNKDAAKLTGKGIDLDGYTIPECIEDNEAIRRALGYPRINLLSESYGTRLAYLYGLQHPDNIYRSAMIGVNPPGHFVWDPEVTDRLLRNYAGLWSTDSLALKKSRDLYATMRDVLNAMPRRWFFFRIDPGKVRVVTFALLFHTRTAAMVFDAYCAADRGDPSGLALMSLVYDFTIPSMMTWGDLASKAVSADYDSSRVYCAATEPNPDFPLSTPMNQMLWCPLKYGAWPIKWLPEEFRRLNQSETETLLLSGDLDFSTPPGQATDELLPTLENGKQVVMTHCGHVNDVWYANAENTRRILKSFYDTGTPDLSLNAGIPVSFQVRTGFQFIAKVALGAAALILLVVTWFITRFIMKLLG